MRFQLRRVIGCVLFLLVVIATLASNGYAQRERAERVFDAVPRESRTRLLGRLKEYVGYERTRQYEKLYELLYDRDDKNGGKEAYFTLRLVAEDRSGVVQDFTPTFIMDISLNNGDPRTFSLTGRAKVFRKGTTVQKEMAMRARLQDGEWYFSELLNSHPHID